MDLIWILTQTNKLQKKKKNYKTSEDNQGSVNTNWIFDNIKGLFLMFLGVIIVL